MWRGDGIDICCLRKQNAVNDGVFRPLKYSLSSPVDVTVISVIIPFDTGTCTSVVPLYPEALPV
jgi:hypothetical protein